MLIKDNIATQLLTKLIQKRKLNKNKKFKRKFKIKQYLSFRYIQKETKAWKNIVHKKDLKFKFSNLYFLTFSKTKILPSIIEKKKSKHNKKPLNKNKIRNFLKIKISTLCAQLVEEPFEKVLNFKQLIKLCYSKDYVVQQWILISLTQVFRLLLPSFHINSNQHINVKFSKSIYDLKKFEKNFLKYWTKFINFLRKRIKPLRWIVNDTKDQLMLTSYKCICRCFEFANHFNLNIEILKSMVPFLNHPNYLLRTLWLNVVQFVLKKDSTIALEITNQIVKFIRSSKYKVHVDLVEILMNLSIEQIDIPNKKKKKSKQKRIGIKKNN